MLGWGVNELRSFFVPAIFVGTLEPLAGTTFAFKRVPRANSTLRDPLTPKTLVFIRENKGCHAAALINGVYRDCARCRFALLNPQRNALQTWRSGMCIARSLFVWRTEERAARMLDTL